MLHAPREHAPRGLVAWPVQVGVRVHGGTRAMNEHYSRRVFLMSAAAGAAGLAAASPSAGAEPDKLPTIPIIDPHQHLWDLKKFRLLWLPGQPTLNHSFLLSDYRK